MTYKSIDSAPNGAHRYFLVRVRGIHPSHGSKYVPTTVQQINGELFTPDNEIEPIVFTKRGTEITTGDGSYQPTTKIAEADLEWTELPDHY